MTMLPDEYRGDTDDGALAESPIFKETLKAADVPPPLKPVQRKATRTTLGKLLDWVRGRTPEVAETLLNEKLNKAQLENYGRAADAIKTMSEAKKNFAEADRVQQETAKLEAEAKLTNAVADTVADNVVDEQAAMRAFERLEAAVSRLKQLGGDVQLRPEEWPPEVRALLEQQSKGADQTDPSPDVEDDIRLILSISDYDDERHPDVTWDRLLSYFAAKDGFRLDEVAPEDLQDDWHGGTAITITGPTAFALRFHKKSGDYVPVKYVRAVGGHFGVTAADILAGP